MKTLIVTWASPNDAHQPNVFADRLDLIDEMVANHQTDGHPVNVNHDINPNQYHWKFSDEAALMYFMDRLIAICAKYNVTIPAFTRPQGE